MGWLKRLTSDYEMTEYRLGKRAKINPSTLSTIKKYKTPIDRIDKNNLKKIAKTLNATPEQLKRWYK